MLDLICYHCDHCWSFEPPLSRGADCPNCSRPSKVCLNCRDYDPHAHHECRESQAEWVRNKEGGNFCSYFTPRPPLKGSAQSATGKQQLELAALFAPKDASALAPLNPDTEEETPQQKLARLFAAQEKSSETPDCNSLQDEIAKFLKSK